jgi:hypothetical protein
VVAGIAAPFLAGAALMMGALLVAARAVLHGPDIDAPQETV